MDSQIRRFNFVNNDLDEMNTRLKSDEDMNDADNDNQLNRQHSKALVGWVSFCIALVVVPFFAFFCFMYTFVRSVFGSLLLFRGFSFAFKVPFVDLLKRFLGNIFIALHLEVLGYLM
ncbi:hypothetical protein, partial [Phenylobacterium aquaticum]|uniref:hypothetical protein n=1 Tax=Phenylobacterium aquaticum TaxID=1763816 RepID=UPI0026F0DBB6